MAKEIRYKPSERMGELIDIVCKKLGYSNTDLVKIALSSFFEKIGVYEELFKKKEKK